MRETNLTKTGRHGREESLLGKGCWDWIRMPKIRSPRVCDLIPALGADVCSGKVHYSQAAVGHRDGGCYLAHGSVPRARVIHGQSYRQVGAEQQLSALSRAAKLNASQAVGKASRLVHLQRAEGTGATGPGASPGFAQLSGDWLMPGDGLALLLPRQP